MKVYDCFSFFNELDLLEIRFHELYDVVDYFVLVEATRTFTGNPKHLYYQDNKERFAEFEDKIIHIVVDDMPITQADLQASLSSKDKEWIESDYQTGDHWIRDRFQRYHIMDGIKDADPDDIIIIEDADEMVRASVVEDLKTSIVDGSNAIGQALCTGYVNVRCTNMPWWGSKVLRRKFITTPNEDRFHTPAVRSIENGGWHFNYMMGADAIRYKIRSFAHSEFNILDVMMNVEDRLEKHLDVLGRKYQYEVVPLDDSYPKYLLDNQDKFSRLIYKSTDLEE